MNAHTRKKKREIRIAACLDAAIGATRKAVTLQKRTPKSMGDLFPKVMQLRKEVDKLYNLEAKRIGLT